MSQTSYRITDTFKQPIYGGQTRRIGILGGTFNPIHSSHLEMAQVAYREFNLSQVIFIPSGVPPHKKNMDIASGRDRLAMIDIACADNYYLVTSSMELDRPGNTYTIDTLERLKAIYSENVELCFIVGSDTLLGFPSWLDFATVAKLTSFIIFPRASVNTEDVEKMYQKLKKEVKIQAYFSEHLCPEISSTEIRSMIRKGLPLGNLVPKGVEDYILHNRLYTEGH